LGKVAWGTPTAIATIPRLFPHIRPPTKTVSAFVLLR